MWLSLSNPFFFRESDIFIIYFVARKEKKSNTQQRTAIIQGTEHGVTTIHVHGASA
jgi:hypothetical protein